MMYFYDQIKQLTYYHLLKGQLPTFYGREVLYDALIWSFGATIQIWNYEILYKFLSFD